MPTLSQARTFLARYGGQGNSFVDRLNFVTARLLPEGNFKGTKTAEKFAVYVDNDGNRIVTLRRGLETILAGAYQAPNPDLTGPNWFWCGEPIPIQNSWYQYSPSGPGNYAGSDWQRGIIPLEGRFTTFCDWKTPMLLRVKAEQTELAGKIVIRGSLAGKKYWTTFNGGWNEGVELAFTTATVTTTQKFDQPPYEIIKTLTKGRIQLFTVDDEGVETLVGFYDPDETNPSYVRYKIPVCQTTAP